MIVFFLFSIKKSTNNVKTIAKNGIIHITYLIMYLYSINGEILDTITKYKIDGSKIMLNSMKLTFAFVLIIL
ncbi:hypothetical protein D3C72_1943920 [compost metagenome]